MKTTWAALGAITCLFGVGTHHAAAAPAQVDQALSFIRAACGMANTSLEMKPTPEGRLELRVVLGDGRRGAVALVNRDLDNFTDRSTSVVASQSGAQAACLDQYVNEVISTLVTLPASVTSAPVAAPNYTPPVMAAPPVPAPLPAQAPPRPALPATGDLPVGVVNGTVGAAAPAAAALTAQAGRLAVTVAVCKGVQGQHVQCDLKVANRTNSDLKLTVKASETRLLGEEGTRSQLYSVRIGEQTHYPSGSDKEVRMDLIADAAPTLQFHFYYVPEALLSIKRLDVVISARIGPDGDMQTFSFANVPIRNR